MPLKVELQEGESLIFEDGILSSDRPSVLGVTDRAVFVTREKYFAKESWYLDRIPISAVTQVFLRKERRIAIWGLSLFVFLGGAALWAGMAWNVYREMPGTKVSGWPLAFVVLGIIMPFLARGRKILVVQMADKSYKWKPRLMDNKTKIKQLQEDFLEACQSVGIYVLRDNG